MPTFANSVKFEKVECGDMQGNRKSKQLHDHKIN